MVSRWPVRWPPISRAIGVRCPANPAQKKVLFTNSVIFQQISITRLGGLPPSEMGAARLPIGAAADWLTNPTADLPEIVRRSSFARGMARRSHVRTRLPDASNIRCRNVIRAILQI